MTGNEVAVIIPCFAMGYLKEAVLSVQEQTVPVGAIYMVLDAPDRREIFVDTLIELAEASNGVEYWTRLTPIYLTENKGVSGARNAGIAMAQTDGFRFFIPLDDDDLLVDRFVERMLQALTICPNADILYPDWVEFDDLRQKIRYHKTPDFDSALHKETPFVVCSSLMRIKVWEEIRQVNGQGYDEDLTARGLRWEDYLFYQEADALGYQFVRVAPGALLRVRRHGSSGSDVANETIPQWRKYRNEKIGRLY